MKRLFKEKRSRKGPRDVGLCLLSVKNCSRPLEVTGQNFPVLKPRILTSQIQVDLLVTSHPTHPPLGDRVISVRCCQSCLSAKMTLIFLFACLAKQKCCKRKLRLFFCEPKQTVLSISDVLKGLAGIR